MLVKIIFLITFKINIVIDQKRYQFIGLTLAITGMEMVLKNIGSFSIKIYIKFSENIILTYIRV